MALDNALICESDASPSRITDLIRELGGTLIEADDAVVRYAMPGLLGTVLHASTLSKELTKEKFGFVPTFEFLFRLNKFEGFRDGLSNMTKIVAAAIRVVAKDCVLLIGEDEPVLVRKKNTFILKRSEDDEPRRTLLTTIVDAVGDPYEFGDMPDS